MSGTTPADEGNDQVKTFAYFHMDQDSNDTQDVDGYRKHASKKNGHCSPVYNKGLVIFAVFAVTATMLIQAFVLVLQLQIMSAMNVQRETLSILAAEANRMTNTTVKPADGPTTMATFSLYDHRETNMPFKSNDQEFIRKDKADILSKFDEMRDNFGASESMMRDLFVSTETLDISVSDLKSSFDNATTEIFQHLALLNEKLDEGDKVIKSLSTKMAALGENISDFSPKLENIVTITRLDDGIYTLETKIENSTLEQQKKLGKLSNDISSSVSLLLSNYQSLNNNISSAAADIMKRTDNAVSTETHAPLSKWIGFCYSGMGCENIEVPLKPTEYRCFKRYTQAKDWHSAKGYCESLGGRLAEIPDWTTLQFFNAINVEYSFFGAHDLNKEGEWQWNSGAKLGVSAWKPREPNNAQNEDCLAVDRSGWNDAPCGDKLPFVCEKHGPDCTGWM